MEPARTDSGPPEPGQRGAGARGDADDGCAADQPPEQPSEQPSEQPPEQPPRAPWPPPAALVWAFGAGLLAVLVAASLSFGLAGILLAGLLLVLAVLHLVLPISALGPLAVRTPWVDAATCLVLAVGVAVLAVVAPGGLGG